MTEPLPVRTRFAPSPTGMQHIGGYRTALFSWLLARHAGGQFVLRIEDTDTARTEPGAVEALLAGFRWLGMAWDEGPEVGGPYGPYTQTQRSAVYHAATNDLLASGNAYRCFCTSERLKAVREDLERRKLPPRYDRLCRALPREEAAARAAAGETSVVRLAVPLDGQTRVPDALRGEMVFENANLDDAVLLKSNGLPTYHLAHVVDDHLMRISHIVRAEEWISSAPLHVLLWQAFGWEMPILVHVPDVLSAQDGKKLSKRRGAVPLMDYPTQGYLPEAVLNYMALLGWSFDDRENVLSVGQMIEAFSLERVGTSPARYDAERLLWFNGHYIRRLAPDQLLTRTLPYLERSEAEGGLPDGVARPVDRAYAQRVLLLEQERMKTLAEAPAMTAFFFTEDAPAEPTALIAKQLDAAHSLMALERALGVLEESAEWSAAILEERLRALVGELSLRPVQLFTSLRMAVTGRTVSPPLFETMEVLGREKTLRRLRAAIERLRAHVAAG